MSNPNLVKFQVNKGQSVRNQPDVFMVDLEDALKWQEIGIGIIVKEIDPFANLAKNEPVIEETENTEEPKETENIKKEKSKANDKKAVK